MNANFRGRIFIPRLLRVVCDPDSHQFNRHFSGLLRTWWMIFVACAAPVFAAEPVPLVRAHAHNDYEHARPLLDALDHGFGSIEADVWLVDGELLIGHTVKDLKPNRTLTRLYLDPLRRLVRENGGRVHESAPQIVLLVDVKSAAAPTYSALHALLLRDAEILTVFRGDVVERKAVTVIISGNRTREAMAAQPIRYAAMDGRSSDLETNPPAALVPWISENWQKMFKWQGEGVMPEIERANLKAFVERAHEQGRKVRFWNTSDRPGVWKQLREAGVDIIGTDDLAALTKFFRDQPTR